MEFVAIDVETANADMASICQIGIAQFKDGTLAEEWKTYVDPQDHFDEINVSIHGIDEDVVAGSPTFAKLADTLISRLSGRIIVTHTAFDRVAVHQASTKHKTPPLSCTWLDTAWSRGELGQSFLDVDMGSRAYARPLATISSIMTHWRTQKQQARS
jgi:DNA polymerase III subunit epsilon